MPRVGVLLAGVNGATGSTFAGGVLAMAAGLVPEQHGTTGLPLFSRLDLPEAGDIAVGGWDYVDGSLSTALSRHGILEPDLVRSLAPARDVLAMPAPRTPLDIPPELDHTQGWIPATFADGVGRLCDEILTFRKRTSSRQVVVLFVGSPHRPGPRSLTELSVPSLLASTKKADIDIVPSGLLYATAAIKAGAHFADFTPSDTLEAGGLVRQATDHGVQLAGRDGSTGQTMLKLAVAQMLRWRNLELRGWFSDNLIGNHDGYVLSLDGHRDTKLRDKRDALHSQVSGADREHHVRINYIPYWGDRKESWDAVECTGWLGNPISLRLNWRAGDSLLAAPLLFDLVRLLEHGAGQQRVGLVRELGFFFKRPLGVEASSLAERFALLCTSYCGTSVPSGTTP